MTGEPTILPGKFPKLLEKYGLKGGTEYVLSLAKNFLKKDKLQTYIGNNGQQYVKTPNGVKSLINYSAEKIELELGKVPTYGEKLGQHHSYISNKNAEMIKEKFGNLFEPTIKYIERPKYNLDLPKAKKIESLYSKNTPFDANLIK